MVYDQMIAKYKDKIQRYTEYALMAVIVIELLFYVYANLFKLGSMVDVDFARVLRHVMEIGDKRTIFLPHWDYITTAELDHSAIFAIPIYMLTGNILISYGIANLINVAIWVTVLHKLLILTGVSRRYRLLATSLILTIFDFGMLAYTNMLFIGGEHYTQKVFLPLIFITLLLTRKEDRRAISTVSLCILYFILLFVTAVSSGIYVFICGILPVIIYMIFRFILSGRTEDTLCRMIMSACSVIITLSGIIVCKVNHVTPNSELAQFKSIETVRDNLFSTFLDLVEMFRIFPEKSIPVMSLGSVMSIVRLFLFAVILIFGLLSVGKIAATEIVKAQGMTSDSGDALGTDEGSGYALYAEQLLISVFLWNYFILFVSGSQQRYHILGAVPLMICAVIRFAAYLKGLRTKEDQKSVTFDAGFLLYIAVVGAILLLNLYQVLWGSRQYFHREDYSRAVDDAVISFMEEHDAGSAFSLYESGYGTEWLRYADKTRTYETYLPDSGEVLNHDFYYSDRDRSSYTDRNVLIATEYEFDSCPSYIKDNYVLSGDALNYGLYLSEHNPIDGVAGPIEGMDTTDLVTAPGYEVNGDIDAAGHLTTDKTGEILISPSLEITMPCKWTLDYKADQGADSVVELYAGEELIDTVRLSEGEGSVSFDFPGNGSYGIVVNKTGSGRLTIGDMRFTH